jgi:GntR family transcriptional regulator
MARYVLEAGPVPLHHQVYLDLRASIENGDWKPGDRVPPERELASRYGCSLITVRHALGELAREGRLQRSRGRGTFVTAPRIVRELATPAGFADEMRSRGRVPSTSVITARLEPASPAVAEALGIPPGAATVYLERVRAADGMPLMVEQVHLPAAPFPGLLEVDLEHNSLYETLASRYGCRILRVSETIEPILLHQREAGLLGQSARQPALLFEGTAYTDGDRAVEYGRSIVAGGRAKYAVETSGLRARPLELIPQSVTAAHAGPNGVRREIVAPESGRRAGGRPEEVVE